MSEDIVQTSSQFVYLLRYRSLITYLLEVVGLPSPFPLTLSEQISYRVLKLFVGKLAHYHLVAVFLNHLLRFSFYKLRFKWILRSIIQSLQWQEKHKERL